MKIIGPESLQQSQPGKPDSCKSSDKSADFSNTLQKAMGRNAPTTDAQKSTALSEPMAIQSFLQPSPQTTDLADKATQAIDLLETYSYTLSDPQKSLKDIEPTLSAFIDETESMYRDYVQSGNSDTELKEVMDSLLRTARSEAIRFNRGDYLDS